MALINPFPEQKIRKFLSSAGDSQKFLLSLFSAQRAVILANESISGYSALDRLAIDPTLDFCWYFASTDASDRSQLANFESILRDRLVPESDDTYEFYNSATNDAIGSLIYTVRCGTTGDPDSAYYAAETLFNLSDLLLNRNRTEYVSDLAAAPITAYAANCISSDVDLLSAPAPSVNAGNMRDQIINEGHELSRLALAD